jgi:enoyl-CoA hydratase
MPATRFLGPALGSLHLFFHRLGPVLARRMLLTDDIIEAAAVEHLGVFTETCAPEAVTARTRYWAEKASKMPVDGVVIAKEAFRLRDEHFHVPEPGTSRPRLLPALQFLLLL